MASNSNYNGLFKVAKQLTLGKCECGKDILVDVELAHDEQEEASTQAVVEKEASAETETTEVEGTTKFASLVHKASSIVDQLDEVANQVENKNPRLAARIDAVSNEIEKRVARLLQRRQNAK